MWMHLKAAVTLTTIALITGCASTPVVPKNLEKRLAVDFQCPREQVTVRRIVAGQYAVEGCGKRLVYSCERVENGYGKCSSESAPTKGGNP